MDVKRAGLNAGDSLPENVIVSPNRWRAIISRAYHGAQWQRSARRAVLPVLLLALWQYASTAGLFDASFVPSPTAVLESWSQWIFGPRSELAWYSGTWLEYVYLSAWRVLVAARQAS